MARKNRRANRAAGEPTPEQKEQDEFIEELAGEDFNSDLDEPDEEGEEENEEVTELEETETKEREEEVVEQATEPNVKTEEEGDEAGKQKEVTSLDDDEEDEDEVAAGEKSKTPEELEAEAKAKAEEAKKPEPTAEELEAQRKEEEDAEAARLAQEEEDKKQKPLTDEEAAQVFTEWRQTTEELLAQHHYALTQEQIDEFEENPAAFIPKAMSRVYMDSISAAFNQFTNYLPRMVGMVLEQRESMNAAEKAFFDKWPDLLNHRDAVLRLGQAYRSANPHASMDDFINEVGAQTMVALRLNPANGNGQVQQQQQQPQKIKPFKPAVETPSGGGPKKREGNVFEQLSDDFDMIEEELDGN